LDRPEPTEPNSELTPKSPNPGRPGADPLAATPSSGRADSTAEVADAEIDAGSWIRQHWLMLMIMGGLLGYLYYQFGVDGLISIGKAALGLSLVIFIHELGHYLAAKWCGVRVQVFSIGFGPAIPGCHFQWGDTYYKLAIFPFGGYVQMLGQVDVHEESDGSEDDPRSYRNKSVLQRMFIISSGVIMNGILAIIIFVIVFQGPGKQQPAAVVAAVDSGAQGFEKGIPPGAAIDEIGQVTNPTFKDLMIQVIWYDNAELPLKYHRPGDKEPTSITLFPKRGTGDRPLIGVAPASIPVLEDKRFVSPDWDSPTLPNSAAAHAKIPFAYGDKIIATTDPVKVAAGLDPTDPNSVTDLRLDPRNPQSGQRDFFQLAERLQLLAGQPMIFRVQRESGDKSETVDITVEPEFHNTLGIDVVMTMGEITNIRKGSAADQAGVRKTQWTEGWVTTFLFFGRQEKIKQADGDKIVQVEVSENGQTLRYTADPGTDSAVKAPGTKIKEELLDPLRLPDQLRAWAKRLEKADVPASEWKVKLLVRRKKFEPGGLDHEAKLLELIWNKRHQFDRVEPFSANSPLAIPELGLAYKVTTTVAQGGESSGLRKNDVITGIKLHALQNPKQDLASAKAPSSFTKLEPDQWALWFAKMQRPEVVKVSLQVNRDGQTIELDDSDGEMKALVVKKDENWPLQQQLFPRGLVLGSDKRLIRADDFVGAVSLGFHEWTNNITEIFVVLRGIVTGGLSPNNIGGPVMIANIAYRYASIDFWEFLFFIGMISVHLAVINFLPIPVLDGGHMVFLAYELVRGKPASEQVRVGATYLGLLFIACLFVFVLYLDISRLFFL
jgi:regulator of sigma E protease